MKGIPVRMPCCRFFTVLSAPASAMQNEKGKITNAIRQAPLLTFPFCTLPLKLAKIKILKAFVRP
jgi:hypothetical protein